MEILAMYTGIYEALTKKEANSVRSLCQSNHGARTQKTIPLPLANTGLIFYL